MTREQIQARELISLIEGGSRLTCEMKDRYLFIDTDAGNSYRVDPDASRITRSNGRPFDLCELEMWVDSPDERDPLYDDPPMDEAPPPPLRIANDLDWERVLDLQKEDRDLRHLEDYWRRENAA